MQGVPKVPLPFPGSSPRAIPAEGAGWCSHKYSMGNHLYSPALAQDPRGGEEAPKGSPSHHLEKGTDNGEQDLLGGTGQHESGLGLQRSPGEAPSIFLFLWFHLMPFPITLLFSIRIFLWNTYSLLLEFTLVALGEADSKTSLL